MVLQHYASRCNPWEVRQCMKKLADYEDAEEAKLGRVINEEEFRS